VYCRTRKRTKEISDLLNGHQIISDFYHAGLDQETRKQKQEDWIKGQTNIMVCTNAFGMGIDKANVRIVIHADVPDCLENYYQEAGRAGRDGQPAKAILLYREQELEELKTLPDIKYPSIYTIRKVYHALGNYFQLPIGVGKGEFLNFNLDDFLNKFKLDLNEVVYSLQALKQEEIISYLEKTFSPSSVQFISNRNRIESFEELHSDLEPIIKALLRTYGGIFDGPVNINETQLAWILKRDIITIKEQLLALHQSGIIEFIPKNDKPQISYLQERIKSEELQINHENYLLRKKEYAGRINSMINYTQDVTCKSMLIGNYFGDTQIQACGICDNCEEKILIKTREKNIPDVINAILTLIKEESKTIEYLKQAINADEKSIVTAIAFLKDEDKVSIQHGSKIGLK
jgi:ATP-dependent DNA helicase RecQ